MFQLNDPRYYYPSRRWDVCACNVVATSQPLATQAGIKIIQNGGNAIGAALSSAITPTVGEPVTNGIGDGQIIWRGTSDYMDGSDPRKDAYAADF